MLIKSCNDLQALCQEHHCSLDELALLYETSQSDLDQAEILEKMQHHWQVMKEAIQASMNSDHPLSGGKIVGRESLKLIALKEEDSLLGPLVKKAVAYSLGTMEVNMSMGLIVAAPTAGASGVVPGVLKAFQETHNLSDKRMVEGLLVAGLIGLVIAKQASVSGAIGGCQAEIGSAAAMGAATLTFLRGGSLQQIFDSGAMALNNTMGLICDPVAGLVEVPCHKRNAMGATNSILCSELAIAGMPSIIPFDETILTMKQVGNLMPSCHRETANGGVAITPTGLALKAKIMEGA